MRLLSLAYQYEEVNTILSKYEEVNPILSEPCFCRSNLFVLRILFTLISHDHIHAH